MIAQRLYESGFITYMRTDSVNLSEFATIGSKDAIIKMMGERYVHPRHFETKTKGAQEAHEAIRPTYMENQSIEGTIAQEKKTVRLDMETYHCLTNGRCGTGKDNCYNIN